MEKLGINTMGLLAQVVNVGILLFVFLKFLYKPILKVLEKRQQSIEGNIRLQEQLEAKLEAMAETEKELVKHAKIEANKILETARHEAKKLVDGAVANAKSEVSALKDQTRENFKKEVLAKQEELESMMAAKATEIANRAIGKLLNQKTRDSLTEKQVSELVKKSHIS